MLEKGENSDDKHFIDENISSGANKIRVILLGNDNAIDLKSHALFVDVITTEPILPQLEKIVSHTDVGAFLGIEQVYHNGK